MGDDQSSYAEKLVIYLYVCTYDYGPRSEKFAEINNDVETNLDRGACKKYTIHGLV